MKPNIFNYAKSELTNDAIICWMLDWANSEDERYKNLSQDIIRLFTKNEDLDVKFVKIKKQYKNIDVLVEVNNSEVIVIEDKVKTSPHSNQLEKYKDTIDNEEVYKNYNKHYIYYKVGNESQNNGVEQAGYTRVRRDEILNIIKKYRDLNNDLLNDYIDYLESIETPSNMYKTEDDINKWCWETWEGYYNHLEDSIKKGYWHYVSNPKGGFLAFIWNCEEYKYVKDNKEINYYIYPQIESNSGNSEGKKTKLTFKLECKDTAYRKELRENIYERLEKLLKGHVSVHNLKKPKFRNALHMTIIEINNINTRTELEEIIKFSTKCLEEIKCQLTEGEVYTNV
ncbi:MAG: PD-(D/E)XK nuclease family protein [Intestinibacter bartlettii]|uniref:PD-(D/E)XK nuclease family protein n=1 Tax=Intestinibacter bartlettii TaxID=261299 RepID=UPI0026F21CD1|nr:PD-(D/E)XK nuclease family protein [Intestinibacter bartlettii]MDO5010790.1 PD-(D/E)XK nuclease family protein [Intestinibacter bartlettii]